MTESFYTRLRKKQRGVALVTALLIVSLATIMAVELTSRQYMDIRRTGNIMASDQAYLDAIAAETFAGLALANYRDAGQNKYDSQLDFTGALFQLSGFLSGEGRQVAIEPVYPESKFNVNTLVRADGKVNEPQEKIYRRLLNSVVLELGGDAGQVSSLVSSLLDWIDEDEEARIDGAEDSIYESKDRPYKAANRMLASITELRLVEGYTEELLDGIPADEENEIEAINGLLSYLDALPDIESTINVNLVSEPKIFTALATYLDEEMALALIDSQPFENLGEFKGHETFETIKREDVAGGGPNYKDLMKTIKGYVGLEVQSSYFLIKTNVAVGKTVISLNSLVYVNTAGTDLEVISRAIGTNGI